MTIETDSGSLEGNAGPEANLDDIISASLEGFDAEGDKAPVAEATTETTTESAEADIPSSHDEPAETQETGEQTDTLTAPQHWTAERKAAFDTLPEAAKKAWLDQAKDYERGLSQQGEKFANERKSWQSVDDALKPYEAALTQQGLTKGTFLGSLVQAWEAAQKNPVGHIQWVMQQSGITPEQLFGQNQKTPAETDEWIDPTVRNLRDEYNQRLSHIERAMQDAWEAGRADRNAALVAKFVAEKDAEGNPVYPYYNDELSDMMAEIISTTPSIAALRDNPAQQFKLSYDLAVAKNHKQIMEAELQKRLAAQEAERTKSARTIRPQYGSQSSSVKPTSQNLDAIIEEQLTRYGL